MSKFLPGQSGNPGGRPKELEGMKAEARKFRDLALETLVDICGNKRANAFARVTAANSLLDRGFGKPTQAIEHSGQIDNGLEALLAAIDGKTRGLPPAE
jgi:hypothetical protein